MCEATERTERSSRRKKGQRGRRADERLACPPPSSSSSSSYRCFGGEKATEKWSAVAKAVTPGANIRVIHPVIVFSCPTTIGYGDRGRDGGSAPLMHILEYDIRPLPPTVSVYGYKVDVAATLPSHFLPSFHHRRVLLSRPVKISPLFSLRAYYSPPTLRVLQKLSLVCIFFLFRFYSPSLSLSLFFHRGLQALFPSGSQIYARRSV